MSSKFTQVFNTLPLEAQQLLVEKHLAGLLDVMPKDRRKEAAARLQTKYKKAPKLDLRRKRKQINDLLDDLARDAKVSFIKERSNREELLSEIVDSLVSWLNDIWISVYEYNINFLVAHSCLLFVADALAQLADSSTLGGCKCSVMNLPVEFALKDKHGKIVKQFAVMGPQNINRILLWIWRDLFVCLFAKGSQRDRGKVPDCLEDIQSVLGDNALQRLLYGGKPARDDDEDEDEEDPEDEEDFDDDLFGDYSCVDDDSEYDSDETDRCLCNFRASYWPESLNRQRMLLRDCVETHLFTVFRQSPSIRLHHTLLAISGDLKATEVRISSLLSDIAGDSPDTLITALDIHLSNGDLPKISSLLESYMYLIRPRDAVSLQYAVATLDGTSYSRQALRILEKELEDSLSAIHSSIRSCFAHIEEEPNKKELAEILNLRIGTPARKARIEHWVEQVLTTSSGPMHPLAFTAMMMGLPMLPGVDEGDDADLLNYVDLDQNDADLDDLREEFRPNLKLRFDGWVHLGETMNGGTPILARLYANAIEKMPYLRGADIISEMVGRLRDRPNKNHLLEALSNLSSFAKVQRKKSKPGRGDTRRTLTKGQANRNTGNNANQTRTGSSSSAPMFVPGPAPASTTSTTSPQVIPIASFSFGPPPPSHGPPAPLPFPFPPVPGGMEDVD
ncbi:hypothetical protein NLJ89_g2993 [Agrocybe chaxingu]|uniref:Uncharacterized protein n=1 Tax=Agrocybe chaxingu TaxID=84603 RepID=A0A9W8KBP6_9AGAR|nr:hypothetical protein NLJ89_g2993 [Agrocybe chaxingu]